MEEEQEYRESFESTSAPEYLMMIDDFVKNRNIQNLTDRFYIYVNTTINKLIGDNMLTFDDKRKMKTIIDDKLTNVKYLNPWAFALAYYSVDKDDYEIDANKFRKAVEYISSSDESLQATLRDVDIVRYCRMLKNKVF